VVINNFMYFQIVVGDQIHFAVEAEDRQQEEEELVEISTINLDGVILIEKIKSILKRNPEMREVLKKEGRL